jgi:hypothetical protein
MRKFLISAAAVIVVFVAAVAAIVLSGNLLPVLGRLFGPDHDFDPARAVAAPDYASESAWAALPWKADEPHGIQYAELASPLPGHTWAQCRYGTLFVEEQLEEPFVTSTLAPGKNYHGLDYPLFYMDIRENARARVRACLESKPR